MNRWFICEYMAKTSFTVHLDQQTAEKIVEMKEENPTFSRNALIRLAISEYRIRTIDEEYNSLEKSSSKKYQDMEDIDIPYMIQDFKMRHNALHKQLNPDWKRKKSLPYHFPHEYDDVANYTSFHGKDSK